MEEKRTGRYSFLRGLLCGIAIMLILVSGAIVFLRFGLPRISAAGETGGKGSTRTSVLSAETEEKLGKLSDIIDLYYYDEVDDNALEEGLYSGLLEGLEDPYSEYYTADEYKSMQEGTSGVYYGIGAVLSQHKDTKVVTILHVYPGTPAEEAGVKDGDILFKVGDIEGTSMELTKLVQHIKGEEGTTVHLTIVREGETDNLSFDVERRKIEVPTVQHEMLDGETGLIQIAEFSEITAAQFLSAVEDLKQQGMTAMVIDLRDNPGGLLSSVCEILDEILPEGVLVYTEDKYGNRKDYTSKEGHMEIPIAVLINENSASAAEIFAGAIKDFEYGTLIGVTSFGKGIVQQVVPLEDGSAVKITIAKYFTPSGNYIHEMGILPDVELKYEYLSEIEEGTEYDPMYDNQVLKALEVLKNQQ